MSLSLAIIVSYVCSGMSNVNSSAAVSIWFLGGACEAISLSRAWVYGSLLIGRIARKRVIISFRLSVRLSLTASDRKCASILMILLFVSTDFYWVINLLVRGCVIF